MLYTIFDAHCDTIKKICDSKENLKENNLHISLEKMSNNKHIQMFAAFVNKKNDVFSPFKRANQLIDCYFDEIKINPDKIIHCTNISEINDALSFNKVAALLSIEGGEALEGDLNNLDYFYSRGVRAMTLTWNYDNEISGSIGETDTMGLTEFGKKVVSKMNELGMLVDVSHISNRGFWDVIENTTKPIAASHSNAISVKNHKRNLSDGQIKAIIKNNGFIGINLYTEFLTDNDCGLGDVIRHIEYILNLGGENNIGFGTDFDGMDNLPNGINGMEDISKIPNELIRLGYSCELVEKITYKNFIRLFNNL